MHIASKGATILSKQMVKNSGSFVQTNIGRSLDAAINNYFKSLNKRLEATEQLLKPCRRESLALSMPLRRRLRGLWAYGRALGTDLVWLVPPIFMVMLTAQHAPFWSQVATWPTTRHGLSFIHVLAKHAGSTRLELDASHTDSAIRVSHGLNLAAPAARAVTL